MHAQLDRLAYAHTSFFTTEVAEELADLLVQDAPAGISHAYFVSGGSEAVEAALKMARQYFVEIGQPQRRHFIARRQSYHGNTLGALAVGGNAWRRKQFAPLLIDGDACRALLRVPRPPRRRKRRGLRPAPGGRAGRGHRRAWAATTSSPSSPRRWAAPPQGAVTPVPGYLRGVRELCSRHGILLILDEVMCGMGRCGTLHACEAAKAWCPTCWSSPRAWAAATSRSARCWRRRSSSTPSPRAAALFQHGHTYIGHADGLRRGAGGAAGDPPRRPARAGAAPGRTACASGWSPAFGDAPAGRRHPRPRAVPGHRAGAPTAPPRQPFDPGAEAARAHQGRRPWPQGLMVYPMGGTVDGQRGDHVLLAPPFIVDDDAARPDRAAPGAGGRRGAVPNRGMTLGSPDRVARRLRYPATVPPYVIGVHAMTSTRKTSPRLRAALAAVGPGPGPALDAGRWRSRSSSPSAPAASPACTTPPAAPSAAWSTRTAPSTASAARWNRPAARCSTSTPSSPASSTSASRRATCSTTPSRAWAQFKDAGAMDRPARGVLGAPRALHRAGAQGSQRQELHRLQGQALQRRQPGLGHARVAGGTARAR